MLKATTAIGVSRLASWLRTDGFSTRGRYEDPDLMGGPGRMADWLEISCLLRPDAPLSRTTAIDHLVDSGMLADEKDDQDTAEQLVSQAFLELAHRKRVLDGHRRGAFPFSIDVASSILRRKSSWEDRPLYLFLLLASIGQLSPGLYTKGTSHHEVGHLFEEVVQQALIGLFGEPVEVLAATGSGHMGTLAGRVEKLLVKFERTHKPALQRQPKRLKDGGVDLVARLNLGDTRPGTPHILVQCSTGNDWTDKLLTPAAETWREWVEWKGPLYRAFAVPTAFGSDGALEDASRNGGWTLLLDRTRILFGLSRLRTPPSSIEEQARRWCRKRINHFKRSRLLQ